MEQRQQQAIPAGWYLSPEDPALVRFWDGELWTERVRTGPSHPKIPLTSPDGHIGSSEIVLAELEENEEIKAGFRGRGIGRPRRRWVAATNERLIVIRRKGLRGWENKVINYDDVKAVGLIDACCGYVQTEDGKTSFTVQRSSTNEALADVLAYVRFRRDFDDFEEVDLLSLPKPGHGLHGSLLGARRTGLPAPTQTQAIDVDSLVEQIRKLDALRTDGLLTDDEFNTQKRKLLADSD